MIHLKAPGLYQEIEPLRSWGHFVRYLEIGDDLYPTRHVDVYENGHRLRYDRTHWVDVFGILAQMKYNKKKWEEWWGPSIEVDHGEFEQEWQSAMESPTWNSQVETAQMSRQGTVPPWLLRKIK